MRGSSERDDDDAKLLVVRGTKHRVIFPFFPSLPLPYHTLSAADVYLFSRFAVCRIFSLHPLSAKRRFFVRQRRGGGGGGTRGRRPRACPAGGREAIWPRRRREICFTL